jgi:hypothetical protein
LVLVIMLVAAVVQDILRLLHQQTLGLPHLVVEQEDNLEHQPHILLHTLPE